MIGGIFGGAAATATNESLLNWRKLQEEERRNKAQEELQKRQLELAETTQKWNEERARILDAHNMGVHDDEMDLAFAQDTIAQWENMDTEGKLSAIADFREMGQSSPILARYAKTLQSMFSNDLSVNPREGMAILTAIGNAEPGQVPYTVEMVEIAATSVADALGYEGDQRDAFITSNVDLVRELMSDREVINDEKVAAYRNANLQAQADIADTESQISLRDTQNMALAAEIGREAEKHPLIVDQLRQQNRALELDNFAQDFQNGTLGRRWELEQRAILADIANAENQDMLFDETFDYQVRTYAAQANISESEAAVVLATQNTRILIEEGNLDLLRAQIRSVDQATATDAAQQAYLEGQTALLSVEGLAARTGIITELVASGNPELLTQLAPELLADFADEEDIPGILESLTTVATEIRDTDMQRAAAEAVLAVAEGEYYERTLDARVAATEAQSQVEQNKAIVWWEELARQRDLDERGMRVQEGQLQLGQDRLTLDWARHNAQIDQFNQSMQAKSIAEATTLEEVLDGAQNSTGWDSTVITSHLNEIATMEQEYEALLDLSDDFNIADPVATKYGLMSAEDAANQANLLLSTIETRKENLVNGVQQLWVFAASKGFTLQPGHIGLPANSSYFERALARMGIYSVDTITDADGNPVNEVTPLADAVVEAHPQVLSAIDDWLVTNPDAVGNILTGGAVGLFEALRAEHGQGVLDALNIRNPRDMERFMEPIVEERTNALNAANLAAQHYGHDITDINGRQAIIVQTQQDMDKLVALRHQITTLDNINTPDGLILTSQVEDLIAPGVNQPWGLFRGSTKGSLLEVIDQSLNVYGLMQNGVIYFNFHRPPQ